MVRVQRRIGIDIFCQLRGSCLAIRNWKPSPHRFAGNGSNVSVIAVLNAMSGLTGIPDVGLEA